MGMCVHVWVHLCLCPCACAKWETELWLHMLTLPGRWELQDSTNFNSWEGEFIGKAGFFSKLLLSWEGNVGAEKETRQNPSTAQSRGADKIETQIISQVVWSEEGGWFEMLWSTLRVLHDPWDTRSFGQRAYNGSHQAVSFPSFWEWRVSWP